MTDTDYAAAAEATAPVTTSDNKSLNCRLYEQKYPEVEDIVMVRVKSIAEMGAYVTLLEYDNLEGMILLSELSRRRIRSISKLIRVGRTEVVQVLRVDKVKEYFDLSKRRVQPEDVQRCEERYNKAKAVHSIMRQLAEMLDEDLEQLNTEIAWPLYRKFGHAFDAFRLLVTDADRVLDEVADEVVFRRPEIKDTLISIVQKRLKPQPVKVRADIEVTCFGYEGIDAIKEALTAGEQCGSEADEQQNAEDETTTAVAAGGESAIKISLVAPPMYVVVTTCYDKNAGIQLLNKAIKTIESKIAEHKGQVVVKAAPRTVSAGDDHSLSVLLEQLTQMNREVEGDEDYDEDYEV